MDKFDNIILRAYEIIGIILLVVAAVAVIVEIAPSPNSANNGDLQASCEKER